MPLSTGTIVRYKGTHCTLETAKLVNIAQMGSKGNVRARQVRSGTEGTQPLIERIMQTTVLNEISPKGGGLG